MGELIEFSRVSWRDAGRAAQCAVMVSPEGQRSRWMLAELYRLAEGADVGIPVPPVSDRYIFVLDGHARLNGRDGQRDLEPRAFASLVSGAHYRLTGVDGGEALVLSVTAPPPGTLDAPRGGSGGTFVAHPATLPVVEERESGKRRVYLAAEQTTGTRRAHGMIVTYRGDTVTRLHHHPDAESLFVFLDGRGVVLIGRQEVSVGPGQAVYYGCGDPHAVRSQDAGGMSFLEFHIPAGYSVVVV